MYTLRRINGSYRCETHPRVTDLTQPPSRKRSKAQLLANAKSEKRARANEKSENKSNKLSKAEQSSGSDNDVDCDSE